MSDTTPGAGPERRDVDGDGVPDEPTAAQRHVDPTADEAADVDRLEPPRSAPSDAAGEPPIEPAYTGTEAATPPPAPAAGTDGDTTTSDRSELDEAVERARTEHPPVVQPSPDPADRTDTTAMQRDDLLAGSPDPVRAQDVRRETGVPETVGAAGATGVAAASAPAAPEPPAPQAIYVQAPPAPRTRGNRGFGILVGLIATVLFALLYAGISYLVILAQQPADGVRVFGQFAAQPVFWIPVLFFFIAFALLAVILNRAAWWSWAVFGLLVGVVVYFAYIGASLLTVGAWQFTPAEAADFLRQRWLDPFAIIAFIVARELPIWFGGWIAAHGRTVGEHNREAREEYERQLAAGPQPISSPR
ncbi:hypothetical protein BCL57_002724 [Agromyces flavus]|uniref:Uncharacterized protein n=1 Tax=Agromyces flavus TaxID=589382 RepID=A0A1H1LMT3_9MICO|nr:hypothetical protein [Agromyces flavus]MCP2368548.1 hypothetical protein [Agromyces flavus]GGI48211.1 hypothetical protein GCM10010932_28990 [Agromyces flavus]SDR75189.1 hypothetical protein SAMN04489721_0177 [Agromyces flavus]